MDEEEKDYLAKNMSIYDDCALNVDLHSRTLLSNKHLTKSAQLNIAIDDDDMVLRHTFPVFTRLGRCPIVSWDFAGAMSIFGPDALPVIHQ